MSIYEVAARSVCFALALATLGLSIIMTVNPPSGDSQGGESIHPPLFTFIFVSCSLIVNFEELLRSAQCYAHRIHPALVLVLDLITILGLLFSAYLVIYPTMFGFATARDVIWVSTALAVVHMHCSLWVGNECDKRRRAYSNRVRQMGGGDVERGRGLRRAYI